jgi:hypothetical protein
MVVTLGPAKGVNRVLPEVNSVGYVAVNHCLYNSN